MPETMTVADFQTANRFRNVSLGNYRVPLKYASGATPEGSYLCIKA